MNRLILLLLLCLPLAANATFRPWTPEPVTITGPSTDTKPVQGVRTGTRFIETDTQKTYRWTGSSDNPGTSADWTHLPEGVTLETTVSGENQTLGTLEVSLAGPGSAASANITSATSTEVCDPTGSGASETVGFFVNSTTSGTIRFADDGDGTCSSGFKGGAITPAAGAWYPYPVPFTTAICVLTANTIDVTVVYRCAD